VDQQVLNREEAILLLGQTAFSVQLLPLAEAREARIQEPKVVVVVALAAALATVVVLEREHLVKEIMEAHLLVVRLIMLVAEVAVRVLLAAQERQQQEGAVEQG
jgi:hypothetical protein